MERSQIKLKAERRVRRRHRIRARMHGTASRPRLTVFRSLSHMYAQIIDDDSGRTLVSTSTLSGDVKGELKTAGNRAAAQVVGRKLAEKAKAAGVSRVVFDRNGYRYHGRVKALADAAREGGLEF